MHTREQGEIFARTIENALLGNPEDMITQMVNYKIRSKPFPVHVRKNNRDMLGLNLGTYKNIYEKLEVKEEEQDEKVMYYLSNFDEAIKLVKDYTFLIICENGEYFWGDQPYWEKYEHEIPEDITKSFFEMHKNNLEKLAACKKF